MILGMRLKDSTSVFNAFTDETRLRIMNLLGKGELCVCDLVRVLKEPQSKVSRHLAYLRRARLVESRKKGLWMFYRLSNPAGTGAILLASLKQMRGDFEELGADLKELNKSKDLLVACCK